MSDSRARNDVDLGAGLGDPERWGGTAVYDVPLATNVDTGYVFGPQLVRAQFQHLRARAVDLVIQFALVGVLALDPAFALLPSGFSGHGVEVSAGVGQVSIIQAAAFLAIPARQGWSQLTGLNGSVIATTYQLPVALPAVGLGIRPVFRCLGSAAPPHTITVTTTILLAPRASI